MESFCRTLVHVGWGTVVVMQNRGREREEMEGEENNNYKHLTEKMSRIYTSAPRNFTIIDGNFLMKK